MAIKKIVKKSVKKEVKKSSDFAVLKTGGKQYLVREGQEISIEKIEGKDKDKVEFEEILLISKAGNVKVGKPKVEGTKVEAKIIGQIKGNKVVVFKMKPKKRYRKTQGHRQKLTKVLIEKI